MDTHSVPPQATILNIIAGFWLSRALFLAAKLKLADVVGDDQLSLTDLAERINVRPEALRRLMRALTSNGIFREERDGTYAQTALSEALRGGRPGSVRGLAEVELGRDHYSAWADVESCLGEPETAFERVYGEPVWSYYSARPELAALFGEAMTNLSGISNAGVLNSYRVPSFKKAVDVGGGQGAFLKAVLDQAGDGEGILFDLPSVTATIKADAGSASRLTIQSGDFFKEVPAGGDLYLLKFVLHDWDDVSCETILANIRRAIAPRGRLLIVEQLLPEANEHHLSPLMDLNMMVMTGGMERVAADYERLLKRSGFRLDGVAATHSPFSVLEASATVG